jgi:hypothetical protein
MQSLKDASKGKIKFVCKKNLINRSIWLKNYLTDANACVSIAFTFVAFELNA